MSSIPAGYKQTEVGVIPQVWEVRSLAELCSKITDGTHDTPTPVPAGRPFLTAIHIKENFIDYGNCLYLTEDDHRIIFSRCNPQNGDVLMVNIGAGVATTAFVDVDFEFSLKNVALLKPESSRATGRFLNHSLIKRKAAITQALSSGGAQPFLSLTQIGQIRIPTPPKSEQETIAAALSDVDTLLAKLDQLIAKKRDLKQAAMQQLLTGQTRLPGFSGEWSAIKMSKQASLKARIGWQALTTAEYMDEGNYFLVTGTDFIGGRVNWSSCHYVDQWRYDQDRNIQLRDGDVLLTKDGTIGKVGYVDGLPGPATLNSGVFVIRPLQESFSPLFLFYILRSKVFDEFLAMITAGSTIVHLYQKDFVTFEFLAPDLKEQTAIATILSDMDAELTALEARRDKTRALKQGMMQELLTGRIRLV